MDRKNSNYPQFKQAFWIWFDSLSESKKKSFWYYKWDTAETNFYFTVWEKERGKR